MSRVLLALGANLGNRRTNLDLSLSALTGLPSTRLLARSGWYETAPVGGSAHQPSFLNGAVLLETTLPPQDLASELRHLETQLGRQRHERWDARTIDLDLLLYAAETITTTELQIPHPRMAFRRFVLDPACEIAGAMIHPTSGWTLAALRRHWQSSPRTVSVQSNNHELTAWLSQQLSPQTHNQSNGQTLELVDRNLQPAMKIFVGEQLVASGPVVHIAATDRDVILHEALAAIAAAWPD
jgi:2-amino-4-hydroxy-6-hydroxymethyldihydropteridine diphosphokinase